MKLYVVHFSNDGIDRHYACETYFDAIILNDALQHRYTVTSSKIEIVTVLGIDDLQYEKLGESKIQVLRIQGDKEEGACNG